MSIQLEVRDLIVTRQWGGEEKVEICQYKASTGFLMYTLYDGTFKNGVLRSQLERFLKDTDSLPYSSIIICSTSEDYVSKINEIANNQMKDKWK